MIAPRVRVLVFFMIVSLSGGRHTHVFSFFEFFKAAAKRGGGLGMKSPGGFGRQPEKKKTA